MEVACGQCIGCRQDRARAWAIRCVHEGSKHVENSFVTLTYRPEEIPQGGTLKKEHFQKFLKRLRRSIAPKRISYFHCGEYGEKLQRPHYHALLFGHDFADKRPWKKSHDGSQLYTSAELERLWGHGFCSLGALTYETASYCSSYVLKKVTGKRAESHYQRVIPDTGEIIQLQPEYITMSTRPAIGRDWIEQFQTDVYPSDEVVSRGRLAKPPRYYDKKLRRGDPEQYDEIKKARKERAKDQKQKQNRTPKRLAVREEVKKAAFQLYKRDLS